MTGYIELITKIMAFEGNKISSRTELFNFSVEGDEFFRESTMGIIEEERMRATTNFRIIAEVLNTELIEPDAQTKEQFYALYGPYSVKAFTEKINATYAGFREATVMTNSRRQFVRRMWLFKRLYDLFDGSMGLIEVRMKTLIPNIYAKAVHVIGDVNQNLNVYSDSKTEKYALIALASVRRVYQKVVEIMAADVGFLRLLTPDLMLKFAQDASPYMVSKIRRLPWVEPETALAATPNHYAYWTEFWNAIFARSFSLSTELCRVIAEYMPMDIQGEMFMDFFRKRYRRRTGYFISKYVFKYEKEEIRRNGQYFCDFKIVIY